MILQGNSIRIPLRDESVHCCVSSYPYYGLRSYDGVPPTIWGGDSGCPHVWETVIKHRESGGPQVQQTKYGKETSISDAHQDTISRFCQLCGAWLGCFGLEPTIALHVQNAVLVSREIKRVLRKDGIFYLNYGDSYSTSKNGRSAADTKAAGNDDRTFRDKPFSVTELPTKNLCMIPARVAIALQDDGWILRSEIPWIKCLSGGVVLYARTQKGDMPMTVKDLVRLNPATVQLWNGEKWTQALGWQLAEINPNRKRESGIAKRARANGRDAKLNYIELELRSGERIGCTSTHQWPTERGLVCSEDLRIGDILCKTQLPEPEYPRQPEYIPDAIGWFIGLYLAEGSRGGNDCIQISGHIKELERLDIVKGIVEAYGGVCKIYNTKANTAQIHIHSRLLNAIIDNYISGRVASDKHLSMSCWQRSNKFLQNVLEGYLHGDGHWDARNNRWRLGFTDNKALATDLRTLCARLGVSLRLKRAEHQLNGEIYKGWRGQIRFSTDDRSINSGNFLLKQDSEIVAIRQSGGQKFWDIAVADEPHLFSLASGILTHNSNAMPSSVTDRPGAAHEHVFMLVKSARYYFDMEAVRKPAQNRPFAGKEAKTKRPNDTNWHDNRYAPGASGYGHHPNGRALRTSDPFFDSLDSYIAHLQDVRDNGGMLVDSEGVPAALVVNSEQYKYSHYATFPRKLISPLIKTTPEKVCPACSQPWKRIVEKEVVTNGTGRKHIAGGDKSHGWEGTPRATLNTTTTGWQPTCKCIQNRAPNFGMKGSELLELADEVVRELAPIGAVVLDCFCGSGTVGAVCRELGRRFIGIDLSAKYLAENALPRSEKKMSRKSLGQLPMFAKLDEAA